MSRVAKGRILVAVMVLVSAWSVWAFAQGRNAPQPFPGAAPGQMRPGAPPAIRKPSPRADHPQPPSALERETEPAAPEEAEGEGPKPFTFAGNGTKTVPYYAILLNFVILLGGYYFFGKDSVAKGLQSRRDTIAKDIDEAQRMLREAEARAKTYQAKLTKLETDVAIAQEALVHAGEAERDRIVGEAEAKAERMRKDTEFLIEQEMKQIRLDLWKDTVEVAMSAAEDLLKKRVTHADQERLAEDYLMDLGGRRPGTSLTPPKTEMTS